MTSRSRGILLCVCAALRLQRRHFFLPALCAAALGGGLSAAPAYANVLSGRLRSVRDTTVAVWLIFGARDAAPTGLSGPALYRRAQRGIRAGLTSRDSPVLAAGLGAAAAAGARLRTVFKWANAASFAVHASLLPRIAALPQLVRIVPVRTWYGLPQPPGLDKKADAAPAYGKNLTPLEQAGIPAAHEYLRTVLGANPGEGVTIAFFDAGFPLAHRCFDYARRHGLIVADSDFVDGDGDVDFPDAHGAQTLSLCAGYDPGVFMGAAWAARYVLARTEATGPELHIEEDYWVAALAWAESLGVDIVNSSVGYRYDFTAPDTDYAFIDMDGRTTTISATAARYATECGVIIVNAMGNEGGRQPWGTMGAPADAEGVISVGAVTASGAIASFSSRGPTADGRIKPDLAAMGAALWVPVPDSSNSYLRGSGTSFAAPIVSGVCALILQAHRTAPAEMIRRRLYASCQLLPWQDSIDNVYGRGLPNANLACRLAENQAVIHTRDSAGVALAGIPIFFDNGSQSGGVTGGDGNCILTMDPAALPETLLVGEAQSLGARKAVVTQLPQRVTVTADYLRAVVILCDSTVRPVRTIAGATAYWRAAGSASVLQTSADSAGRARIYYATAGTYDLWASAAGYYRCAAISAYLGAEPETLFIALTPRAPREFVVYPTVVRLRGGQPVLHYEFVAVDDGAEARPAVLTLRTIGGKVVWQKALVVDGYGPVYGSIDVLGDVSARIVPGTYIFCMRYGAAARQRKILILG